MAKEKERVNHPDHYNSGGIETIDYVDQITKDYPGDEASSIGEVIKYVSRAPLKNNKLEDLEKAAWYLHHAIKLVKRKEAK